MMTFYELCNHQESARFFALSQELFAILHLDGSFRWVSPGWRTLGFRPEELGGSSFFDLIHPDNLPLASLRFDELLTRGSPTSFTSQCVSRQGLEPWISWNLAASPGEPFVYVIGRDVSGHVAADKELRKTNEILNAVLQTAPVAICACDLEDRVQFWNAAAETLFGWKESEVLNQRFPHREQDGRQCDLVPGQRLLGVERRRRRKDGTLLDIQYWTVPLMDRDGSDCGTLWICHDITEQKKREAGVVAAEKAEALSRLAGGVARDFSDLLTIISGYTKLLAESSVDPNSRNALDNITIAANQALFVCGQLTAFSPHDMAHVELVDINEVICEGEQAIRRFVGEAISVSIKQGRNLNRVSVDRSQMRQLLLNLVIYARHAMPGGGHLNLETQNCDEPDKPRQVTLVVHHTGHSLEDTDEAKLFEPFLGQDDLGATPGLALFAAQKIARSFGSSVRIKDDVPGTAICVSLPVSEIPLKEGFDTDMETFDEVKKVLVVDDNAMVREFMRTILSNSGYTVLAAGDGPHALSLVESAGPFDLVITDVIMPDMSGVELADRINEYRRTRILFVSGYPDETITMQGLVERDAEFLSKPFGPATLLERVKSTLNSHYNSRPMVKCM